ncbi:MAG: hypothetical protein LUQ39_04730 [Methanomassiliicoccales archaeon]|nr:hypothetical protein [Methanomassiliicoccales archaeon]
MSLRDKRGLEGLPLKLLITVMILALSIQPLYASLSYLGYGQELGRAVQEAEAIKEAAVSAYLGGPGNIRKVSISMNDGPGSFSIRLGGAEGEGTSKTIDILYYGNLAATVTLEGQSLSIISMEGQSLIVEGKQELRLTCCQRAMGDIVLVERI